MDTALSRKNRSLRRASRPHVVALPAPVRQAPWPSESGNRLVMAGLYLALLLGAGIFLGLMYFVISG